MTSSHSRAQSRQSFLVGAGWATAACELLAADASFRRYFRLSRGDDTVLLMDAPPERERIEPFANIARHLERLGLSAPRILAEDPRDGWLLLEDFGDATFTHLLADGHAESRLYELAIDVLVALHRHHEAARVDLPPYDLDVLLDEACLFTDWFVPAVTGRACPGNVREAYRAAWTHLFARLPDHQPVLVLRDYHVDNLMLLPDRPGIQSCGLLDFQDALLGHPAYDLASLVEDARRDIDPALRDQMIDRYRAAVPDDAGLAQWYAPLAAQRHAKVAGIFVRLWKRDGKPVYLQHIPRVLQHLARHLQVAPFEPLASWMQTVLPDLEAAGHSAAALAD